MSISPLTSGSESEQVENFLAKAYQTQYDRARDEKSKLKNSPDGGNEQLLRPDGVLTGYAPGYIRDSGAVRHACTLANFHSLPPS